MLYQLYSRTEDGYEMNLGYYPTVEDAEEQLVEMNEWRPGVTHLIREVN